MYRFHQDIRRIFRGVGIDFDILPPPVKEALFDIAWTVGPGDFSHGWRMLIEAIKRQDWEEAGNQSRRDPTKTPADRNSEIKNLFWQPLFRNQEVDDPISQFETSEDSGGNFDLHSGAGW